MANQYEEFENLILEENFKPAEQLLFNWMRDHPNDAYAWLLYGKCVTSPSQKQACFRRVLALDPSNFEAQELLGKTNPPVLSVSKTPDQLDTNKGSSPPFPIFTSQVANKSRPIKTKPHLLSESIKTRLPFILYSFLHLLFTIFLGGILIYAFLFFVPGLLAFGKPDKTIQHTWISTLNQSNVNQEIQNLANIFLNPSHLDYHTVSNYQDLKRYRTSITTDPTKPQLIEFTGVNITGQLMGGSILTRGDDGRPLVIMMDIAFDEITIPVVYYGPFDIFQNGDTLLIEGVYIAEANGIAAQHVERIAPKGSTQPSPDSLLMVRVAGVVLLWALLCASIFLWKLNLKKWWRINTASLSPLGIILVLLLLSAFSAGCSIDLSTTINSGGNGITTILVHETKDNMDFLRSVPGISGYLKAVIDQAKSAGALFDQYVEGDQEVFLLQRNLNNTGEGGLGNTYPAEGSWIYIQKYEEGNEEVLRFLGTVDTRTLYVNSTDVSADVANVMRDQLNQISMTYHLTIPGRLVYHNGKEETNQQISWQIRMNDVNYLVAEKRFPIEDKVLPPSYLLYIWITFIIIFLLATSFLISSIWIHPGTKQGGKKK